MLALKPVCESWVPRGIGSCDLNEEGLVSPAPVVIKPDVERVSVQILLSHRPMQ